MVEHLNSVPFRKKPEVYSQNPIHENDVRKQDYNLTEKILERISFASTLVDIGCGSAVKLLPLAPYIEKIVAIDNDPTVVAMAQKNVLDAGLENIHIKLGNADHLPFSSNSIDMVTFMHTPINIDEAYRVLKKDGYVVAERIGEQDKPEIKTFLLNKNENARSLTKIEPGEVARKHVYDFYDAGFLSMSCENMFWETKYSKEDLWLLLNSTSTVGNLNLTVDTNTFEQVWTKYSKKGVVTLTQHRVLVIARV
jgi:SAM-dependent methyltransferase